MGKRPRFTIAAILWLTFGVAMFFGGRWSMIPRLEALQSEVENIRTEAFSETTMNTKAKLGYQIDL